MFETSDVSYPATYTRALETLARNVTKVFNYAEPVLAGSPTFDASERLAL
jgi:hypothetical protein